MPSVSAKQQRYMNLCVTNPGAARKKCPSKKVAMEFSGRKGTGKR